MFISALLSFLARQRIQGTFHRLDGREIDLAFTDRLKFELFLLSKLIFYLKEPDESDYWRGKAFSVMFSLLLIMSDCDSLEVPDC